MTKHLSAHPEGSRRQGLYAGSILISLAVVTLLLAALLPRLYTRPFSTALLTLVLITLAAAVGLHIRFLLLVRREQHETVNALRTTEHEFQAIFDSALDGLVILDDQGTCLEANPAALALVGAGRDDLVGHPLNCFELPGERQDFLAHPDGRGEIEMVRRDGWSIIAEYSAKTNYLPGRHFLVLRDITARKSAELQMASNLTLAEAAWAEADALRKTTLALTQNLSMDYVLDTLLESLLGLVPCDSAQVLLAETDDRLFLARERRSEPNASHTHRSPMTWNVSDHPPLMRALFIENVLLVRNTAEEEGWARFRGHSHFRSWLCIPLVASQKVLGLLSLGDLKADVFTHEHVRVAKSLAIPAAVAIQNARLYERAEIYGSELEQRFRDLEQTQQALERAEENRARSEERFSKVFRASPIAFSITTLDEGRFIDVNEAFEHWYGYSRDELVGRTILDIGIWEDSEDRLRMLAEIREQGAIRNYATRLRRHGGDIVETIYSAQRIELGGQQCILAVTEDLTARISFETALAHKAGRTR